MSNDVKSFHVFLFLNHFLRFSKTQKLGLSAQKSADMTALPVCMVFNHFDYMFWHFLLIILKYCNDKDQNFAKNPDGILKMCFTLNFAVRISLLMEALYMAPYI